MILLVQYLIKDIFSDDPAFANNQTSVEHKKALK